MNKSNVIFMAAAGLVLKSVTVFSAEPELDSDIARASYAIGVKYGENIHRDLSDIEYKIFLQGLEDGFHEREKRLTDLEMTQALNTYQQKRVAALQAEQRKTAEANRKAGTAFLNENAKKPGVKTTASGLQYKVLTSGKEGASPTINDTVRVHYHGTLVDGTVFDSSIERGEPITFPVNGVIKGWTEALQIMKVGDKWQLFIPPELAYGERGARDKIGPESTLLFEVELLGIEK